MSEQRFLDRFHHFKGEPQQIEGVRLLYQAIARGEAPERILHGGAGWARAFSAAPPAPPPPAALDPRGSEEAGMAGPGRGVKLGPKDTYLLINDRDQDCEAYDHTGKLLWKVPALARGQHGDTETSRVGSDTPPGLYRLGKAYLDYERDPNPAFNPTLRSYGWCSFDMDELEGQVSRVGRSGIMLHGGGTPCGWPGAWAPFQPLHPTYGCVRMHNHDLQHRVLPLYRQGAIYVGVFQER